MYMPGNAAGQLIPSTDPIIVKISVLQGKE
jgi:hypothetical protein